jgi:hypothetical protein
VARSGEERKLYMVLVGKAVRMRPLGRPRRRWGIMGSEWILREIGWGGVWIGFDWLSIGTCCERGDESSVSCTTELVISLFHM